MKRISVLILCVTFCVTGFSQIPGGGANRGASGGQNMNMGHFYGKVIDSKTNKGIEAVSIQLIQSKFDTQAKF